MKIKEKLYSIEWRTKAFVWTLSFLCVASIFLFWSLIVGFNFLGKETVSQNMVKPNPFDAVVIEAKSAFVWDVINHRVLFEKDALAPRPLASITKVMTAVTTADMAPNLASITIKLSDLSPEGDSKLKVGSIWNIKDLIDYALLVSSNDGAHALAASAGATGINANVNANSSPDILKEDVNADLHNNKFIERMNELALRSGLGNSTFLNEHGLDNGEEMSGAYGSARDMAILFEYAMRNYPHLLEATRYDNLKITDQNNAQYQALNTDEIINSIPSPIASKTGYTDLAGGNLVVAFDAGLGQPIIISILGSSEAGRFSDMLELVNTTMLYLQSE
jgi:D-alanyl-D-alanine carboxypeptidase (penicillin-binding protein 5/6)